MAGQTSDHSRSARPTGEAPRISNRAKPSSQASVGAGAAAISIHDQTGRLTGELLAWMDRSLRRVIDRLGVGGECRARLVTDAEMARAHESHLGVPGTTDVITFDLSDPSDAGSSLFLDVDLLVCVDEAERQSKAAGIPIEHELMLYLVHGVLHCMGHDDHDADRAATMHALEDEILTAVGIGAVYRRPEAASEGAAP